jgi:hypothetical protein
MKRDQLADGEMQRSPMRKKSPVSDPRKLSSGGLECMGPVRRCVTI